MLAPERPVLRYFGGKWVLAPWVISHFPPHRVYVEPFGGGGSVLMRKPRAYNEIYNDLDGEIVNLFRVLRDHHEELYRLVTLTPFARVEFEQSYLAIDNPIEQARRTIARASMGFGGNAIANKTGFRSAQSARHTTPSVDWANWPGQVQYFTERLKGVVIENRDAIEVMRQQDSKETLHFVDPPYVHDTRAEKHGYRFEMTDAQHADLCASLQALRGMVILCGYENSIYDRLGWQTVKREAHADGAKDRIEVLWINPACASAQSQINLFQTETC